MNTKQPLILLVDDEADFREIFSLKLSAEGLKVETAEDGATGIARAKELQPDLILMDVKMPNMDGATAVMKLKEDPATANLKIVYLTSLGDFGEGGEQQDRRFAVTSGAEGYIRKTEDLKDVVTRVKSFLSQ